MKSAAESALLISVCLVQCHAFNNNYVGATKWGQKLTRLHLEESEWTSDFDDFVGGGSAEEETLVSSFFKTRNSRDLSASSVRQFSLGEDFILSDFVGNMGFDEVTDWEYYYENEDDADDRKVVKPNPMDSSKPKRTRQSSGSVVSILREPYVFSHPEGQFTHVCRDFLHRFEYSVASLSDVLVAH
jgi:hypothetical protein